MATPRGIWRKAAAQGRAHRRLAAHDDPDRGADRDAGGARRRHPLGRPATSIRPRITPRRPSRPPAFRCSRSRARASPNTGITRRNCSDWRDGGTPNMILDDGGDATMFVHQGCAPSAVKPPFSISTEQRRGRSVLRADQEDAEGKAQRLASPRSRRHQGRLGRDDHRRPPPLRHGEIRHAAVPGDQRQ